MTLARLLVATCQWTLKRKTREPHKGHRGMTRVLRILPVAVAGVFLISMSLAWLKEVGSVVARGTTYRDSLQFYTGAISIRSGRAADLYDLDVQQSLQEKLLQPEYRQDRPHQWELLPFISPPFVALALAPLAGQSLPVFYAVTGGLQVLFIAVLVVALQRTANVWPESWRLLLLMLTVLWLPLSWSLMQGQMSTLLAVAFALGYLALRNNQGILAGIILSILWIKPQYAILVLPAMLVWRRWSGAGAFAASMLALLGASWATVGLDGLVSYARLLTQIETFGPEYGMFAANYNTLSGLLVRAFGESGWAWLLAAGPLVILALLRAQRGFGPESYALLILTSVLVSLHTHSYDLAVLLPAAALGWDALKERPILAFTWASLWFAVEVGLFGLAVRGTQFEDAPLLTVPAMLLAVALLLLWRTPGRLVPAAVRA